MTLNEAFGLANKALVDITASDSGWELIKPYAAAFFEKDATDPNLKDQTIQLLSATAGRATKLATNMLGDTRIASMWKARVLVLIQYLGKASSAAMIVREYPPMMAQWREETAQLSSSDAVLLPSLVESLGRRKVGDQEFTRQVTDVRRDLARMVFCDRILVEQIINDKNADYRKALWNEVTSLFGVYIKEQWN